MIPCYLYAKATLLTSLYEGFPNVLVESIMLGTPVIAFDCPSGPNEIVQEGINGFLIEHQDSENFRKKLVRLLSIKFNPENVKNTVKQNKVDEKAKQYAKRITYFNKLF
jgi:glycosyltransferase involved in cell wall biosynthesis